MLNRPLSSSRRPRRDASERARGLRLAVYSLAGGVTSLGFANVVAGWSDGNSLDWLLLLLVAVFVCGWFSAPVLRWLGLTRH